MRITEGPQYFVNRIIFTGNTTTRDNVIRREMRLLEGGVFNTEALKYSVRRLNQLGYFKQLEGNDKDMKVDKTPDKPNIVDVTLQARGAEPQPAHLRRRRLAVRGLLRPARVPDLELPRPRREPDAVDAGRRPRRRTTSSAFTEPFLFDRNITGGFDVYKRSLQYIGYYTQKSTGGNLIFGFPVADFSRMFVNYSYERSGSPTSTRR